MRMTGISRRGHQLRRLTSLPAWLVLSLIGFSTLYPLVFVSSVALKSPAEFAESPFGLPSDPTFQSLERVWNQADFGRYVTNSVVVVGLATTGCVLIACMTGFALARLRFPFRELLRNGVVALMILPASLMIVPVFKVVLDLQLQNTYAGLILVYIGMQLPFAIFMMSAFFQSVPRELLQAASVDGASLFRSFRSIAVPLARPAIAALTALTFLTLWNDLLFSLVILQDPEKRTVQVGMSLLNNAVLQQPQTVVAAAMLISALPPLLLFVLFTRHLSQGLMAGSLK